MSSQFFQALAGRLKRIERWIAQHEAYEPTNSTCKVDMVAGTVTIVNNTETAVLFDEDVYDPDDLHSTTTNTDRITVKVAGIYICSAYASWQANNSGHRRITIKIGATVLTGNWAGGDPNEPTLQGCAHQAELAVGDIVRLYAYEDSGSDLSLNDATLAVTRIA